MKVEVEFEFEYESEVEFEVEFDFGYLVGGELGIVVVLLDVGPGTSK